MREGDGDEPAAAIARRDADHMDGAIGDQSGLYSWERATHAYETAGRCETAAAHVSEPAA